MTSIFEPLKGDSLAVEAREIVAHYEGLAGRLALLQRLTAELARARTPDEVADIIIGQALPALDAEIGVVAVVSDDRRMLRNVGFQGVSAETQDAWREYSVETLVPVAECALREQTVIVTTREERNRRYPALAEVHGPDHGGAVIAFPLSSHRRLLGVLAFCFRREGTFDDDALSFLKSLADQCGLALERARLTALAQSEIETRRASEEALRTAQDRLKLALGAAPMSAWEWDMVAQRVTASEASVDLWGFREGTQADFQRAVLAEDLPLLMAAWEQAVRERAPFSSEYRVRHPSGAIKWLASFGELTWAGDTLVRMNGVSLDITSRKRAEATLRDEARRKDELLAMLAHELRNPLAPIRTAAAALRLMNGQGRDEKLTRISDVLERQTAHMSRMVDDLLDVSRLTQGRLRLQRGRLDLTELLRTLASDRRSELDSAKLQLVVRVPEAPIWISADATRLCQVINNLLHNAQKFTDPGGTVSIEASTEDNEVAVRVRDTGIGMDAATLAQLFTPFTQGEQNLDRSRGGLGLGLAMVKGLVELHGGRVSAESAGLGAGSTLTVRLPLEASAAIGVDRSSVEPARPLQILLIEDNEDAAEMLQMLLELAGHVVSIARTGADGILSAKRKVPDLILCDIGLPDLDGYAVARALRDDPRTAHGYYVALSGYGRSEDRGQALQAGFDAHLTKPVSADVLRKTLDAVARRDGV